MERSIFFIIISMLLLDLNLLRKALPSNWRIFTSEVRPFKMPAAENYSSLPL
jgi:hypothetical protein